MRRDVTERHRGTQRRARTGVAWPHYRGGGVTDGVQTRDRLTIVAQHPREFIGQQAALGANVARVDADRIERRFRKRRETRVGLHVDVAVVAIERVAALAEVLVLAGGRKLIHPRDRGTEARRVDLYPLSERVQRLGPEIDLAKPAGGK